MRSYIRIYVELYTIKLKVNFIPIGRLLAFNARMHAVSQYVRVLKEGFPLATDTAA